MFLRNTLVDKHSSAVVMFASKHWGPMRAAEVTLKILLLCKLPSTTWLFTFKWSFLQVHNPCVPGQTAWISKQRSAVVMLASKLRGPMSTAEVTLEISLVSKLPSTNWLQTIVRFFLQVHKPIVPGQISSVDKHSSAVVMFASKHRGPMSLAEVTLKILLVCKLPSTTCLQAIDRPFLQVHKLDVPREAAWVSKQGRAVDILAH